MSRTMVMFLFAAAAAAGWSGSAQSPCGKQLRASPENYQRGLDNATGQQDKMGYGDNQKARAETSEDGLGNVRTARNAGWPLAGEGSAP